MKLITEAPKRQCSKCSPPAAQKRHFGPPKRRLCSKFSLPAALKEGTLGPANGVSKFSPPAALKENTLGPFGPKAPIRWCSKFSPPAALMEGTLGPSGPKAPMVFKIFAACGAEGGHLGAFRPQSPNGAEEAHLGPSVQNVVRLRRRGKALCAFRPQSADGVQDLVPLRHPSSRKGTFGLPVPKCRGCSIFAPKASPQTTGSVQNLLYRPDLNRLAAAARHERVDVAARPPGARP